MNSGVIIIGITIAIISIIIYIIKNKQDFKEKYSELKDKKIVKVILCILLFVICVFYIKYIYDSIKKIQGNLDYYNVSKENQILFEEFDKKLKEETSYYNEAIKKDYGESIKQPYIPEGFEYAEGDIFSGYVIQDSDGNQYVWVPCTNKDNDKILKLEKRDFFDMTNLTDTAEAMSIRNYECLDIEYKEFIESALNNGGFYISRFELCKEDDKIVSKAGAKIWTDTSRTEAISVINNMYTDVNCRLINGYAYDTTLAWIKKDNDIEAKSFEDLKNIESGRTKYNNIYDITDNIMEITLESLYDTMIYRGFFIEDEFKLNSRYNIADEKIENYDELLNLKAVNLLAFRTVIYK